MIKRFVVHLQERDLEMELGDDYILDLQSTTCFHFNNRAVAVKVEKANAEVCTADFICFFRILGSDERGREAR